MDNVKTCYVDCTETFNSGLNTGIQRVVKNIITRLDEVDSSLNYTFVPVIAVGSDLFSINSDIYSGYYFTRSVNKLLGSFRNILDHFFPDKESITKEQSGTGSNETPADSLHKEFLPRLHSAIVSACREVIPIILKIPLIIDTLGTYKKKILIQKDDIYFVADSFWNVNSLKAARKAKSRQAKILVMIYDIIPLTHPEVFDQTNLTNFATFLPKYLDFIDGTISISKFTMDALKNHCRHLGIDERYLFDYFYLGADFNSKTSPAEKITMLPKELEGGNIYIMVGTIEPRKNHDFVLNAFEKLWKGGSQVKLCIIGKVGWKCTGTMKRITESRYYNKHLFLHNNVSDAELSCYMQKAHTVIMASIVEGFGLPLIEAMHMKKTVLASDIPVFREIGGDYPIYFPLDDTEALMEKISHIAEGKYDTANLDKNWISWDESVHILFDKVIDMAGRV